MTATTVYLSCAETAKLLRKALKASFPGVKFSVRSEVYAGGASIHVRWTDGPRESDVDKVTGLFAGGRFDGMIDLAYSAAHAISPTGEVRLLGTYGHSFSTEPLAPVPDGWTPVHFGADYVFTDRDLSPKYQAVLAAAAAEALASAAGVEGLSMSDDYWPLTYLPTKYAGACLPVYGPSSLVRALSAYVAPDGSTYEEE